MSIKTYNNILLYGSILLLIFFLVSIILEIFSVFLFFGTLGILYLIFIAAKRHQEIESENRRLDLEIKMRQLDRKEKELQEIKDIIEENISIEIPKIETPKIDNRYMPFKPLDDKIRFYTEEDYTTTDITKIFYDVDGMGGVLVGNMRERVKQELNMLNKFIREAQDMRIPVKPFYNVYKIELKLIDNILSIGKIEYSTPNHQYYETLYKAEDKK